MFFNVYFYPLRLENKDFIIFEHIWIQGRRSDGRARGQTGRQGQSRPKIFAATSFRIA